MDGDRILQEIIGEQLRALPGMPSSLRNDLAVKPIYAYCLGAAVALTRAGLLATGSRDQILSALAEELQRLGLATVVKKEFRRSIEVSFGEAGDDEST